MDRNLLFFCSMCRDKSPEEIAKIGCCIDHKIKHYVKGDYIAYQNDEINYLYLLVKGSAKAEMISDSGLVLPMEHFEAPFPLAAAFLFADDNKFPVDVIALEECEVVHISKAEIEKQMATCVGFLRGFMAFNANRMKYLSNRLKLFSHRNIKSKLVYYIMLHEKKGEFVFDMSITDLADYFGVERPSLSRALSEMVADGLIIYKSRKGKILNIEAMQELLY